LKISPGEHDLRMALPRTISERAGIVLLYLLIPGLLILDYHAGREFSLHVFYLAPIGLAAWTFGMGAGIATAGLSSAFFAFVAFAQRFEGQTTGSVWWELITSTFLFVGCAAIVAQHRRFVSGAAEMARVDPESGALSSREFERLLNVEARRARRYSRPFALALLADVARTGKPKGFIGALVRVAAANVREGDTIARVDGAKFGVLMIECPPDQAIVAAERLRKVLSANFAALDPPGFAVALASYEGRTPLSAGDLLQAAETRMNTARLSPEKVSATRIS